MVANKKIKNATAIENQGIKFRSVLECKMYKWMKEAGYNPQFEPDKFLLWEGFYPASPLYIDGEPQLTKPRKNSKDILNFVPKIPKFEDWHYTPDFRLDINNKQFYIECKGYGNDLWPYKRKLFLKIIQSMPNVYFFEAHTKRGLLKTLSLIESIANENSGSKN